MDSYSDQQNMESSTMMHTDILTFWFEETDPKQWWQVDEGFDQTIEARFGQLLKQASQSELHHWRNSDQGRLAEIIVLDQFSRNVYRNTPQAFSQDPMALALAQEAVAQGALNRLSENERSFLLLPYMHSESTVIHLDAEILYKQYSSETNYDFERRHKAIIDRFGRYPHRNTILGRESTAEEIEFLKQPGSSF